VRRMKLCRYILAITVTLTLVVLGSSTVCAQDTTGNTTKAPTYDPLGVLAQFLDVVYPDLGAGHQGLATLKVSFDGVFVLGGVELEFHPCRISGVSTEPSPVPYCGDHSHDAKPFFNANIDFGRDKRTPILSFVASGTFIDDIRIQKIQEMRQRLPRSPSENCFLKAGSAAENRIVTQPVKVHPMKLGAGFPEPSPQLYKWPFLGVSSSIHSRADVTSECCASDKPEPTRLAPSANHAREIAGSRALV